MKRLPFYVFLVVALVFIFSSITASAQQPRAVPPNDNFINAEPIKVGKSYSVPDIGAATNEGGEPVASCKSGSVISHSVWFTITQPQLSMIFLSTFGSVLIRPTSHSFDTVLAVYELTGPGVFTERACADDVGGFTAASLSFSASANTTYYVAAGTYSADPFLFDSILKLNSRMLNTNALPPNYTFETPVDGSDWKLKNGSDDGVVCLNASYPTASGSCTFRFVGTPGVKTKLTHIMPFMSSFVPRKNALLAFLIYFRVMDATALGSTKIRFIITYSDGKPPSIQTVDLTGEPASASYTSRFITVGLKSSKIATIKFEVKFAAESGTLLFDYLDYYYYADRDTRGLLPVPLPPATK